VGPKPVSAPGLTGYPQSDAEVRRLAAELWRDCDGQRVKERRLGKGRVSWGKPLREVLLAERVPPDFDQANPVEGAPELNFIHRIDGETDLYFVANRRNVWARGDCTFRVSGKQPELWDPVSGETHSAEAFRQQDRRTTLPLELAPHGSLFVVFRKPIGLTAAGRAARNFPVYVEGHELTGEWRVKFDSRWGGPESALFDRLVSWTQRPEEGISHYSGKATYQKTVDLPDAFRRPGRRIVLELGAVKDVAEVRLNGTNLGVVWTEPFRVDITEAVRPVGNALEIDVVNLWPNRLIGDAALPPEKRFTQSNVQFSKDHPLLESGLLGPVRLRVAE
jgi:hypothetical protein